MESDEFYLSRALDLAKHGRDAGEVPVGAIVVCTTNGEIVGEAHNAPISLHDPSAHAEILAIRAATEKLQNYRLFDHDIYVTLEPCTMCAGAIANARIRRVIFSAPDEKGGAVINGVKFFEQTSCHWHPEIVQGAFANESADLLRSFFMERRANAAKHQGEASESQPE